MNARSRAPLPSQSAPCAGHLPETTGRGDPRENASVCCARIWKASAHDMFLTTLHARCCETNITIVYTSIYSSPYAGLLLGETAGDASGMLPFLQFLSCGDVSAAVSPCAVTANGTLPRRCRGAGESAGKRWQTAESNGFAPINDVSSIRTRRPVHSVAGPIPVHPFQPPGYRKCPNELDPRSNPENACPEGMRKNGTAKPGGKRNDTLSTEPMHPLESQNAPCPVTVSQCGTPGGGGAGFTVQLCCGPLGVPSPARASPVTRCSSAVWESWRCCQMEWIAALFDNTPDSSGKYQPPPDGKEGAVVSGRVGSEWAGTSQRCMFTQRGNWSAGGGG
eukprot:gene24464-biopygen4413